jgi:hypothetical protein
LEGKSECTDEFDAGKCAEDSTAALQGNLGSIIGLVTSYWDSMDASQDVNPHSILSGIDSPDGRVGYLDPMKSFARSGFPEYTNEPVPRLSTGSDTQPVNPEPVRDEVLISRNPNLPNEVRMITHSDSIPRCDLPAPAPPALPNLAESPLASIIVAASHADIDLDWLESFDNATLETIVPRDPITRRPLTLGSIEHSSGNCRPCIFFLKAKCFKGLRCTFCHFNHSTLRKQIPQVAGSSQIVPGAIKTKRLRPSKRTREMIKQINEQMVFDDIREDPNGPPLSATLGGGYPQAPVLQPYL